MSRKSKITPTNLSGGCEDSYWYELPIANVTGAVGHLKAMYDSLKFVLSK